MSTIDTLLNQPRDWLSRRSFDWSTLTYSAARPALKDEAVRHGAIATEFRQLPMANDEGRDIPGEDQ